jgi:hypothetical protein
MERIIMSGEVEKMKNEAVIGPNYFKVISQTSPGTAEEKFKNPQPGSPKNQSKFELCISKIKTIRIQKQDLRYTNRDSNPGSLK